MPGSNFEFQKLSKQDKKRFQIINANHPEMIVNKHFGSSKILRILKGRNNNF